MGLDDIKDVNNNSKLYWYYSAYRKMPSTPVTSNNFGTGRANTIKMLNIYNGTGGETSWAGQNESDLWKNIPTTLPKAGANPTASQSDTETNRWFIPSKGEWGAFGDAFNISKTSGDATYYGNFGLSDCYWSSSQNDARSAWIARFYGSFIFYDDVNYNVTEDVAWSEFYNVSVRASATF